MSLRAVLENAIGYAQALVLYTCVVKAANVAILRWFERNIDDPRDNAEMADLTRQEKLHRHKGTVKEIVARAAAVLAAVVAVATVSSTMFELRERGASIRAAWCRPRRDAVLRGLTHAFCCERACDAAACRSIRWFLGAARLRVVPRCSPHSRRTRIPQMGAH